MKCIRCGIGRPRLNETLCDRCLRAWFHRQEAKRDKRYKYQGVCASWGYDEWHALNSALIEYLTQLDRTVDEEGA